MNKSRSDNSGGSLRQNRPYILLMGAQLVSNLGDWLYLLALLTLLGLKWNATPWEITAATLCAAVPVLVGGPLAGMIADKFDRKKLMILSDIVRVFIVLGFVFVGEMWQVYMLLIAKGLFDVLFGPAKNGKLKEIVPHDQIDRAVSISSMIEQSMKIAGPAIGGILVAAFGVTICFYINGATFLSSALLLLGLAGRRLDDSRKDRSLEEGSSVDAKPSFWSELAAGIQTMKSIPIIAFGSLLLSVVILVLQIADSQTIVLFREIPNVPDGLLGWCIASSGFGTLLAAIIHLRIKWSALVKMASGSGVMGIVLAISALFASYGPFGVVGDVIIITAFFIVGLGAGMTFIPFQVVLQQRTPEHLIGRVFGTVGSLTTSASIIGPVLGGFLVTVYGPVPAFLLSGLLLFILGCIVIVLKNTIEQKDISEAHRNRETYEMTTIS